MSATQHLIPNQPIYPSPPLTANHHERGAHLPDQNQNQAPKRIAEIPPHLVEIYMDPSSVKLPSSVLAAMNHASQQHPPVSFARQAPQNGSGQSNKAPPPPAPEQRKHLQRRPSSPNQSTHFSYDGPHQPEPATPSEPRPPTQNRTQSDPNVYRDARHQPPPQSVLMQPAHPPPHHQLPRSHPHHQPHQPGPSQAQQAQQHQVALMRQQELKRLSLASAGAPPNLLPPLSITSPTAAGAAPTPVVNGNGPLTAGPASAHPDSHTPPHTNGAPNPDQLVHTLIHHSAAQALAPVRPIFEQAWLETVTNVQREMGRMVSQFDDRYRGLEHDVNRLRGERNKAREEINKMKEEWLKTGERCERYKEERNKLRDELAHCGSIVKNSARDRQEMEDMRKEIFRLRNLLNEPRIEVVNRTPENADNLPKVIRRLTEESYDDVDESFRVGQPRVEAREKQPSVPPKEEPSTREAHAQFHLEMEKMKEQMREQMQREIQIQMKDMLEKGMRSGEGSSGSASPATARPREVSLPAQPTSERAVTTASSTRTSTTLPEVSSDSKPDAEDMDVDQEDSVASGSPESLPPADIETQFPSTMTLRDDQGRQPHANHASATLTGPVLQSHPPPHPHSTIAPSQSHRPSSRTSSPALIQGSLGRRGEGSDVSREMKEKHESVRPLTPSSPGSAFRSREIERPGSGLSGRGRSANSTPVMPYQSFTGAPSEERRRGDSSSRSRPATPRSSTAHTGLKSNETTPSSLPPPPPPPQVPLNRPGSSSSSHTGASPGTSGAQFRKPYTAVDGSPLARPRSTRFSSPAPMSDPESEGSARKRGREEYEDGAASSHQRANTHPSDERARQRVKIEPTSDEQSRLRTLSPSSRAANTNIFRPVEHRESWSRIVPENLPPLQSPPFAERKPAIHPPSGSKAAPTPTSATSSRPPNWDLRSPLSPPATVQVQHWASAPSSQNQWRSEPRPGSSGGRTAVQFPFRKPLVTQNVNGQQQQHRSPTSPTDGNGPSPKGKLSIKHLDLLYETIGEKYHCRVCKQPDSKDPQPPSPANFPKNATWPDLAGHYENAHPKSCEDIEKLSAAQVAELKQQLKSSRFCGFVLS